MTMYVVVNIGCIECGVSSNVVGIYEDKKLADALAEACQRQYSWREGGQNAFEVFEVAQMNMTNPEYQV